MDRTFAMNLPRCGSNSSGLADSISGTVHHAAPGKPVAKTAERLLDARTVEQWRGIAHAASIS